ncbi:hypothetical protein FOC93_08830 [Bacillus cereus]|uniref:hypothetical protein n=1 Tax=Bacillus cereus TaxID=1396 RepID=UPI00156136FC|nr:hypothetical protein [Bacillus cereus]QKH05231.1 hypothetical protein FOC93_08830 [Bacillus cereus]QKH11063.1 hypothetical protein FOC92_28660 [Bacillus cereus]
MTVPKKLMIGSVPYDVEVVKGWIDKRENGEVRIAEVTYHEQQKGSSKRNFIGNWSKKYTDFI